MLLELHPLAERYGGQVTGDPGALPAFVGKKNHLTVRTDDLGNETHAVVPAYPHTVVQSLIIHVSADLVFSVPKITGNVEFVVIKRLKVSRRRSLTDKCTVDIIFSVVVGRNAQHVPAV